MNRKIKKILFICYTLGFTILIITFIQNEISFRINHRVLSISTIGFYFKRLVIVILPIVSFIYTFYIFLRSFFHSNKKKERRESLILLGVGILYIVFYMLWLFIFVVRFNLE